MAKTKAGTSLAKTNGSSTALVSMPEGFELVQTAAESKWVQIEHDTIIRGILMSRESMEQVNKDGVKETRHFYTIQLTAGSCEVEYKNEDGIKVNETAKPGDVVALSERSRLEVLEEWVGRGAIYEVHIHAARQKVLQQGRTLWMFNIGRKLVRGQEAPAYMKPGEFAAQQARQ